MTVYKPRRNQSERYLDLKTFSLQNCEIKFLLFKSSAYGTL